MKYYRRYQKLQKCYIDGTPVEPEEFMAGELIDYGEGLTKEYCEQEMKYGETEIVCDIEPAPEGAENVIER